jgi:hypothetical protein
MPPAASILFTTRSSSPLERLPPALEGLVGPLGEFGEHRLDAEPGASREYQTAILEDEWWVGHGGLLGAIGL